MLFNSCIGALCLLATAECVVSLFTIDGDDDSRLKLDRVISEATTHRHYLSSCSSSSSYASRVFGCMVDV